MHILTKRNGVALVAVMAVLLILTLLLPLMFSYSERAMEAAAGGYDEQSSSYLARSMVEMSVAAFEEIYDQSEEEIKNGIPVTAEMEAKAMKEGTVDLEEYEAEDYKKTATFRLNIFYGFDPEGQKDKIDDGINPKPMKVDDLYMFRRVISDESDGKFEFQTLDEFIKAEPTLARKTDDDGNYTESESQWRIRIEKAYADYIEGGFLYTTKPPEGASDTFVEDVRSGKVLPGDTYNVKDESGASVPAEFVGYAKCEINYNDKPEYYKYKVINTSSSGSTGDADDSGTSDVDYETVPATEDEYTSYMKKCRPDSEGNLNLPEKAEAVFKVENKNVEFKATSYINGKIQTRSCRVVLPTKPAEESWIVPANIEGHQIFPDTSLANSVVRLNDKSSGVSDPAAMNQPVYVFSCVGNMLFTSDEIKIKQTATDAFCTSVLPYGETMEYNTYIEKYNNAVTDTATKNKDVTHTTDSGSTELTHTALIANRSADFSFGLHPETTTVNPESDPLFSCIKTNNMRSWANSARRDNFVAYTATKGIQFDIPINLIINPCRTGRIGDGISENQSLYKILYLQASDIVFNKQVNSMVSLYTSLFTSGAFRMSTIILSAPASTQYFYQNEDRRGADDEPLTVKAGKVYFSDDAYVWVVPFSENGSNYRTQTVYYKGEDIILYKVANAGDVFYFNTEVESYDGNPAGFSLTTYFLDVIYEDIDNTDKWYEPVKHLKTHLYEQYTKNFRGKTYVEDDLKWIGNMNETGVMPEEIDAFYVVWDS